MKISLIIPVYNVEKYVGKCLKSVEEQTYANIEVIVVNDGSTDGSYEIVKRYVEKNSNFKVYSIENSGLGGARNHGLSKASGEYIFFLDSDDYIAANCIELMVKRAQKDQSDIVVCNNYDVTEEGKILLAYQNQYKNRLTSLSSEPQILFNRVSAWGKLYRRELFKDKKFVNREWYEDMRMIPKLYLEASRISYIDDSLVFYVQREGSIMNNANIEKNLMIIDAFEDLISYYKGKRVYQKFQEELEFLVIEHIAVAGLSRVARGRKQERKEVADKMQNYLATFEGLYSNKYMKVQSINRKIILICNRKKWYSLTKVFLNIKQMIK